MRVPEKISMGQGPPLAPGSATVWANVNFWETP